MTKPRTLGFFGEIMNYAVVDIGSNSLRLLVFDDEREIELGPLETVITKLGDGVKKSGVLKEERMEDSFLVFESFQRRMEQEGVQEVYAFCTSAVRGAKNGEDFAQEIRDRFDWKVEIIDGEEEALIGFLGATYSFKDEPITLVDIGGGSTEIIQGTKEIDHKKSIEIGALKYSEEPVDLKELFLDLPELHGRLVGIGGTITTVAAMLLKLETYQRDAVQGVRFKTERLKDFAEELEPMTEEEIMAMPGIDPKRVSIIRGGLAILIHLLDALGAEELTISDYGNLEGYALKNVLCRN